MTDKQYLADVEKLDHPHAIYMISLMQAHDVLRSGLRWIESTQKPNNPPKQTEHLVAFLTTISWIYETIKLLKKGCKNKNSAINKNMLNGHPQLLKIWDEVKRGSSQRIKQIEAIRNQSVFHFDDVGSKRVIKFVTENEKESTPFVEWNGRPVVNNTRYTYAYIALGSAFCENDLDLKKFAAEINIVKTIIPDILKLIQRLLQCIWENIGIKLVLKEDLKEK